MSFQLRPYQQRAVDQVFRVWEAGASRPLISASTGSGKSVMFGSIARRHLEHHRAAGPVVLLAHRKELVDQAIAHFKRGAPNLRVEKLIGSPNRLGQSKRVAKIYALRHADIIATTPQTLASASTLRDFPAPSLIICDEAHHYASESFKRVLTALGAFSGASRALGVTATPFREDHRKLDDIFPVLAASIDITWLIHHRDDPVTGQEVDCAPGEGYLVPPKLRHLLVDGLDLADVPTSRMSGAVDYRDHELAEAMEAAGAFEIVAKTVVAEVPERKGVLFAPTVNSSKHLAQIMTDLGAPCGHVDGTMLGTERDRVIQDFRDDKIRWLSNVGIVSEGFDIPEIDTVVLARPTQSRIFFRQAIGRALRPAAGKDHAVVLDVAGASDGHSLVGMDALTDADVLTANAGESLTELLDRSARARQAVVDQITAHQATLTERQQRGERGAEQITLTVKGFEAALPGLAEFGDRAAPALHELLDTTTEGVSLALGATRGGDQVLDELRATEERVAELAAAAGAKLSRLESLKISLRQALLALKEAPDGEVAKAMVTGHVGTVAGDLFGPEEERYAPKAPGEVQALKPRGARKATAASFTARFGWALKTASGHLFIPVHGAGGSDDIIGLAVAVRLDESGLNWLPVSWWARTQQVDELVPNPVTEERAYQLVANLAAEESHAVNLIDPQAPWRKKPATERALNLANRVAGQAINATGGLPEDVKAGYIADCITYARQHRTVERLGEHVMNQLKTAGQRVSTGAE